MRVAKFGDPLAKRKRFDATAMFKYSHLLSLHSSDCTSWTISRTTLSRGSFWCPRTRRQRRKRNGKAAPCVTTTRAKKARKILLTLALSSSVS